MRESILFGDEAGCRVFLNELQLRLNQGRGEEALAMALEKRRDPKIDDGFALPDPWAVITKARLRGYLPEDQHFHHERFLPFLQANPTASAIGFDLSNPFHFDNAPDEHGSMDPVIEILTYCDSGYPFSTATRDGVLSDWATRKKCPWRGEQDDASASVSVEGLGALYGARERLSRLTAAEEDLYALESAISAIAFFMVLRKTILTHGTPGNRAVVLGSHDDFPFFAAVVVTAAEAASAANTDWTAYDRAEQSRYELKEQRRQAKQRHKAERKADLLKELDEYGELGAIVGDFLKSGKKVTPVKAIKSIGPLGLLAGLALLGVARKKH